LAKEINKPKSFKEENHLITITEEMAVGPAEYPSETLQVAREGGRRYRQQASFGRAGGATWPMNGDGINGRSPFAPI
jgi:hypothetical protein